jgi:hypothetical protein
MTTRRYVNVWCDGAGCGVFHDSAAPHSVREARQLAAADGWVHVKGTPASMIDLCPECARDNGYWQTSLTNRARARPRKIGGGESRIALADVALHWPDGWPLNETMP